MYRQQSVAVVIPAFNEELAITAAIRTVPDFVDWIIVVDDASTDKTVQKIHPCCGGRVEVICHTVNRGVGAAIVTGYRRAMELGVDIAVVMAGDGQMDPDDLVGLLEPIVNGEADYAKGNRFGHKNIWKEMPRTRFLGNVLLSAVTKITSGYWHIFDSQCGYTAITTRALQCLDVDNLFARYGYPNHLLARLHTIGARVVDVTVRPLYGPSWRSGIKLRTVVYPIAFVLLRSWMQRVADEVVPLAVKSPRRLHG